jgi:hypothetical protein
VGCNRFCFCMRAKVLLYRIPLTFWVEINIVKCFMQRNATHMRRQLQISDANHRFCLKGFTFTKVLFRRTGSLGCCFSCWFEICVASAHQLHHAMNKQKGHENTQQKKHIFWLKLNSLEFPCEIWFENRKTSQCVKCLSDSIFFNDDCMA